MVAYQLDLDNEQANAIYNMARGHHAFGVAWAEEFKARIPIPVPSKIGAVVRTLAGTFVRWSLDAHSVIPWADAADSSMPLYSTEQIGPVIEVLAHGVDL